MKDKLFQIIGTLLTLWLNFRRNIRKMATRAGEGWCHVRQIEPAFLRWQRRSRLQWLRNIDDQVRETFKEISVNIDCLNKNRINNIIAVSSISPNEGKTTLCANIAEAMACSGDPILLIDCNIRTPSLCQKYNIDHTSPGLYEVLNGNLYWISCVQKTRIPNLYVMGMGSPPGDPSGILGSSDIAVLLNTLKEQYRYVLIDTPPLLPVSDTLMLLKNNIRLLLVLRHRKTRCADIIRASEILRMADVRLLGVVYNDVPAWE